MWLSETVPVWSTNVWLHLVFTHSFDVVTGVTSIIVYIDNSPSHSDSNSYQYNDATWGVLVGAELTAPSTLNNSFYGFLFDYMLHNYALTALEVVG